MKPDEKPAPTEEQVKAANEAQEAKWQGDYTEEELTIPYKREDKSDESDTKPEGDKQKASKDGDKSTAENEEDAEDGTIELSDPVTVVTTEDPGEYAPADYSFEVTLKDGKKVTIATAEEAEKIADDPDNFETPKQLMDFINKQNKMVRQLERDYEKWESQHKTFTEQVEAETQRREQVDTFTNEMLYLVDKGMLPDIEDTEAKRRWLTDDTAALDKEFIKTPGVREQVELLNYFVRENEQRSKAGVRPLTSLIDAYNGWQLDEGHKKAEAKRKEQEEAKKASGEARKAAGARVSGVSPAAQGAYVPKGIAVGNPHVFDRGAAVWDD